MAVAEIKLLADTVRTTVINKGVTLADTFRAAGDYDNSTELDLYCHAYLVLEFNTTAPSAGDSVAELYLLPGDGEVSEVFPEGGDASVGNDVDPQKSLLVGTFETRVPSITTVEELCVPGIPLSFEGNRFVIKNISGKVFEDTWEFRIKPYKLQSVT